MVIVHSGLSFRLGNEFSGHIRAVEAVAHIVCCFEDDNIPHLDNKVEPDSDIKIIHAERTIADRETLDRRRLQIERQQGSPLYNRHCRTVARLATRF